MKRLTPEQALTKIYHYCAYHERSHYEVKQKLFSFGLYASEVDALLAQLVNEGFLNEERFARAFAGGKFRIMQWGRLKIVQALEAHRLSAYCIKSGLAEIPEADYQHTLLALLTKKWESTRGNNIFEKKQKVARYAIGRGFEPELVWQQLKTLAPDTV